MKEKAIIRIIKRDQRKDETSVTNRANRAKAQPINTKTVTTSDVVTTVSTWVREFKKARSVNPRNKFKALFMKS